VGALVSGWLADKSGRPHLCACASQLIAGICLFIAMQQVSTDAKLLWLTLAGAGVFGWTAPFWVLPTLILSDSPVAASIGFINSFGNLGGFAGPFLVGFLMSDHWPMQKAMIFICIAYFLAAGLTGFVSHRPALRHSLATT
jgi:ACS family tartrate transporter-like MFS transporter